MHCRAVQITCSLRLAGLMHSKYHQKEGIIMLCLPLLLLGGFQEGIDCAVAGELAAPMVPKVLREGDASNFGRYTESTDVEIPVPPPIGVEAADAFFQDWLHNAAEQRSHNGDKLLV